MTADSSTPIPYAYWVEPGRLLAGQYPTAGRGHAEAPAQIAALLAAGVTLFLDLTHPDDEMRPYTAWLQQQAAGRAVEHVRMPIPDFGTPTPDQMRRILDRIDADLLRGQVIYLHCWGGLGRTGTVIGCYLARHGVTGDEALAELARLRRRWPDNRESPETEAQRRMVRGWPRGV